MLNMAGAWILSTLLIFGSGIIVHSCSSDEYGPNCTYCQPQDSCLDGHYTCDQASGVKLCLPGWRGDICTDPVNTGQYHVTCLNNRCRNGGTCSHGNCCCLPGYTGILCEIEIIECMSDSCLNGGICMDRTGFYTCDCLPGYTGDRCEIPTATTPHVTTAHDSKCRARPCINGGTCHENMYFRYCLCPTEFTGRDCQTRIFNVSSINNCTNGLFGIHCDVMCVPRDNCDDGHYTCDPATGRKICLSGWKGPSCDTRVLPHALDKACPGHISCKNDGQCFEGMCCCKNNFSGEFCQIESIGCISSPCTNNGTCKTVGNSFTCDCDSPFTGRHCETDLSRVTQPNTVLYSSGLTRPSTVASSRSATYLTSSIVSTLLSTKRQSDSAISSTFISSTPVLMTTSSFPIQTSLSKTETTFMTSSQSMFSDHFIPTTSSVDFQTNALSSQFPTETLQSSNPITSDRESHAQTLHSSYSSLNTHQTGFSSSFHSFASQVNTEHPSSIQLTNSFSTVAYTGKVDSIPAVSTTYTLLPTKSSMADLLSSSVNSGGVTQNRATDNTLSTNTFHKQSSQPTAVTSPTRPNDVKSSPSDAGGRKNGGEPNDSGSDLEWWIILVIVCGALLLLIVIILIVLVFIHQRRRDSRSLQEFPADDTRFDKEHFSVQPVFSNPTYLNADSDDDSVKEDMYIVNKD